jgi:hypothetical protein
MPKRKKSKSDLRKLVDRFNVSFPIGTPVILRRDSGELETVVRGSAEVLQGHSAVAWFQGISGAYSIEDNRVSAMPSHQPAA